MTRKQIHLNAKGCSGRGVRVALLDPTQKFAVLEGAARDVGADATMMHLREREARDGVCAMVVEITEPGQKTLQGDGVAWKRVSAEHLDTHLDDVFNTKDFEVLKQLYRRWHDAALEEVDAIMGEALDVTED